VLEQRRNELGFFFTLDHGKVVIRGHPVQLLSFQGKVRTIKEEVENERTASVVFNERLFPVASELIEEEVKRLYGSDSSCEILEKSEYVKNTLGHNSRLNMNNVENCV
jgi:malonyl CoA-acyl carrier protein transacylase